MADSSQEEKQNFLREKILEKGYDTNQFVQFLIDKKGEDGADVSVWTMNDLKIVVKEFIKLNGGQVEEEPPKPQPKQEPKTKKISMFDVLGESKPKPQPQPQQTQSQKPKTETTKVEQKQQQQNIEQKPKNEHVSNTTSNPAPNSSNNTLNKQNSLTLSGNESDYGVIIADTKKCKPCETTDIAKSQNVSISLSKPEKKKGGFLAKDYMTYLITTLPVSYKVRRRYSDFGWLRTALQNHFPANLIPPMPKRNRFGVDPFAEQFVSKRSRGLEKFLNYLTKDPIIKSSQIFYDFLYIGAEVDFNSKKKVYEKVKPVGEVQEFREIDEKVKLSITDEKEGYLENIKDNTNININLFKKLNISFKLLFDEMNNVINRMNEISNTWEQIFKASEKYYDNNITCESYKQMSNLFKVWSKSLKEQNTVVNVDIREHFKYVRKNFHSIKDLANSIETYKNNYQKLSKNLMSKKDELFKKGEIPTGSRTKSDFGMNNNDKKKVLQSMLPKDTNIVINAKEMYGLYLNRATSEYERMRMLNGILNKNIVLENSTKLMNLLSQFHICVGEINVGLETSAINNSNDNKCKERRIPLDESFLK